MTQNKKRQRQPNIAHVFHAADWENALSYVRNSDSGDSALGVFGLEIVDWPVKLTQLLSGEELTRPRN